MSVSAWYSYLMNNNYENSLTPAQKRAIAEFDAQDHDTTPDYCYCPDDSDDDCDCDQ